MQKDTKMQKKPYASANFPPVTVNARPDWWNRAYVLLTAALVSADFFGVWYARKSLRAIESQLGAMRQQITEMQNAGIQTGQIIERMKDTAERQLRAYVCMESAQIIFKRERSPEIHVHIKNFGQTPAYDVRMWIGGAIGQYPAPESPKPPPEGFQMSTSLLAPGAKPHAMVWRHPEINELLMPFLGTPQVTIYAYGEIAYKDAFGKPHITKYRLLHGGREPVRLMVKDGFPFGFLKPDTEGNEAD